jgi:hypothetical protein
VTGIWAKDLIQNELDPDLNNLGKFLIKGDGHPTSYFNKIVSDEIKKKVLNDEKKHQQLFNEEFLQTL